MKLYVSILTICWLKVTVGAWDTEELEIFDLVEEINKNFYDFMGITQNASNAEIKKAFRSLSIQLHPDKNPDEDANIQFRNLVSIYEVLKDSAKRSKYDKVLKDGLPNWKSALYYYRRMRKIGLYEGAGILFVIVTIGQYLFAWAAYLEKKYTAEQVFGSKLKKLQKKNKNIDMDSILNEIPTPSVKNTLPIQIPLLFWNLPKIIKDGFIKAKELKEMALEKRRQELEEAKRLKELEQEAEEQARLRKEKKENLRKRRQNTKVPEKTDEELKGYAKIQAKEFNENDAMKPVSQKTTVSGGFWTDDDLVELVRLVKKYPGGSSSRWSFIAEAMNRTVHEVTFMAAKMKENGYRIPGQTESVAENYVQAAQEIIRTEKVKKDKENKSIVVAETNWTQEQQKALEAAIVKYRKTNAGDRWQKIANCVPDKSKEECLIRYKYLCELVKAQNESQRIEAQGDAHSITGEDVKVQPAEVTIKNNSSGDMPQEFEPVTPDDLANEQNGKLDKRRNKRKERRRRRRDMSSGDDTDDAYTYEVK